MPAVEYVYSDAQVGMQVRWVDEEALHGTVGAIDGGGVCFVDLDGEGFADLVSLEGNRSSWWPSRGRVRG